MGIIKTASVLALATNTLAQQHTTKASVTPTGNTFVSEPLKTKHLFNMSKKTDPTLQFISRQIGLLQKTELGKITRKWNSATSFDYLSEPFSFEILPENLKGTIKLIDGSQVYDLKLSKKDQDLVINLLKIMHTLSLKPTPIGLRHSFNQNPDFYMRLREGTPEKILSILSNLQQDTSFNEGPNFEEMSFENASLRLQHSNLLNPQIYFEINVRNNKTSNYFYILEWKKYFECLGFRWSGGRSYGKTS